MDKRGDWAKNITAVLLMLLVVCYAIYNMAAQWSYYRFAVDSGWNFQSRTDKLDKVANGQAAGQEQALDAYAYAQNILGKRASNGFQIVRGPNGELNYTNFFPYETYDYQYYGGQLYELASAVRQNEGQFLFLAATNKSPDTASAAGADFPVADFSARTDAMIYTLQGLGVPWLDSRQVLAQAGFDEQLYRYKTDPRWTVEACFEVFAGMLETLEESYGLELDPQAFYADIDNYRQTLYPNGFSGDFARQAGLPFTGQDDFNLYTPAFETDFTVVTSHYDQEIATCGSFDEVLLSQNYLDAEDPYEHNCFNTYFSGPAPLRVITNHLNEDGPSILLVGDDYSAPLAAFLAPVTGELHYIWPYDNPAVEDIYEYISANRFDVVIWESSPNNLTSSGFAILN